MSVLTAGRARGGSAEATAAFAAAGFAASALVVLAGGRTGTARATTPLTRWLGLLTHAGYRPGGSVLPGLLLMAGISVLVLLWVCLVRGPHPATGTEARVWAIGASWALPLVVGPPLLSSDVYTYAAQGLMVGRGLDPYSVGPSALGNVAAMRAVDPIWRAAPSPYGPLATWLQHLAVVLGGGGPLGAVVVLRLVAVASVAAIGLLAAGLAGSRRIPALTLTVLNPLVLLQVISAAHLEGVLGALLLAALFAVRRGNPRLGIVLACAAGAIKAPALLAVPAIVAVHRQGSSAPWRAVARDAMTAGAACTGLTLVVPHGWGWISALKTPALGYTPGAPASLLGSLLKTIIPWASFDDVATTGRIVALLAAGCIAAALISTAWRRALEVTTGLSLAAVALLSPVIYPWYVLWGALCLAPVAQGRLRTAAILTCASGSLLAVPGLPRLDADLLAPALIAVVVITATGAASIRRGLRVALAAALRTLADPFSARSPSEHART